MGGVARPAVDDLVALLRDEEWLVRKTVIYALSGIAPDNPNVIAALRETSLQDPEIQVQSAAQRFVRTLDDR